MPEIVLKLSVKLSHYFSPFLTEINIIFYSQLNFKEIHFCKLIHYFKNVLLWWFKYQGDSSPWSVFPVPLWMLLPSTNTHGCIHTWMHPLHQIMGSCCQNITEMSRNFCHSLQSKKWDTQRLEIHQDHVWSPFLHGYKLESLLSLGQKRLYTCLCHTKKDHLC